MSQSEVTRDNLPTIHCNVDMGHYHYLLPFDLETTGVPMREPEVEVLEVGFAIYEVTDNGDWVPLVGDDMLIPHPRRYDLMQEDVAELHTDNGLLVALNSCAPSDAWSIADALDRINDLINKHVPEGESVYMVGSGVENFDRPIVASLNPSLNDRLHYRSLDVAGIRRLSYLVPADGDWSDAPLWTEVQHRALGDSIQSLRQLAWLLDHIQIVGVEPPEPETEYWVTDPNGNHYAGPYTSRVDAEEAAMTATNTFGLGTYYTTWEVPNAGLRDF